MFLPKALTNILYDMTTYPEYIGPMREEVETVISDEGWTTASMGKLRKVDSFIKESQRFGLGSCKFLCIRFRIRACIYLVYSADKPQNFKGLLFLQRIIPTSRDNYRVSYPLHSFG